MQMPNSNWDADLRPHLACQKVTFQRTHGHAKHQNLPEFAIQTQCQRPIGMCCQSLPADAVLVSAIEQLAYNIC